MARTVTTTEILIPLLMLSGCAEWRIERTPMELRRAAVADVADAAVAAEVIDGSEVNPRLRLLEDYRGRLRLIAQDPITHRYRVVN